MTEEKTSPFILAARIVIKRHIDLLRRLGDK